MGKNNYFIVLYYICQSPSSSTSSSTQSGHQFKTGANAPNSNSPVLNQRSLTSSAETSMKLDSHTFQDLTLMAHAHQLDTPLKTRRCLILMITNLLISKPTDLTILNQAMSSHNQKVSSESTDQYKIECMFSNK